MADLFPYITDNVLNAIDAIASTMREQQFGGNIIVTADEYTITELNGQTYSYAINQVDNNNRRQLESQLKIFDIVTELNFNGEDTYPFPLVYQYNKNNSWKSQLQQIIKDIINNKGLEAEQLQKYYHLESLYKNKPASYNRQLRALKYELETSCETRTIDFHLRIAKRVKRIFDKKGFNRLNKNIDLPPSTIGRLKEEELQQILEQI